MVRKKTNKGSASKSTKSNEKDVVKARKTKSPSSQKLCYTNFKVVGEIKQHLSKFHMLHSFKDCPFGYMSDLSNLKCQPQLILVHSKVKCDRSGSFTFILNGTLLHFDLPKFKSITGFKCGKLDDFVHDLVGPSKLVDKYFSKFKDDCVPKKEFIRVFKQEALIRPKHLFNMCIFYLIGTFILSSPPRKSVIPYDHFLLVELGKYITYPWGHFSFFEF